jgi:phosphatidylglycerophosphatase A
MSSTGHGLLRGPAESGDGWRLWTSSALGLGFAPVAPGTFGTLGGVLLAVPLCWAGELFLPLLVGLCALLYAVGRSLGNWAARRAANGDPGWFVWDEVLGYLVVLCWMQPPSPLALVTAFVLFRFFDVLKPWPVRRLERLPGGDGILLDDVAAGVLAGLVLLVLRLTLFEPAAWVRAAT